MVMPKDFEKVKMKGIPTGRTKDLKKVKMKEMRKVILKVWT
jgi:hypothetical protein